MSEPVLAKELGATAVLIRQTAQDTTAGEWDVLPSGELVAWQPTEDQRYEYLAEGAQWESSADPRWAALVSPALAEPLASLLEDLRLLTVAHQVDPGYAGMPDFRWCVDCRAEECDALQLLDRAREVVQALSGSGGAR